jgi:hypothetical protein
MRVFCIRRKGNLVSVTASSRRGRRRPKHLFEVVKIRTGKSRISVGMASENENLELVG